MGSNVYLESLLRGTSELNARYSSSELNARYISIELIGVIYG